MNALFLQETSARFVPYLVSETSLLSQGFFPVCGWDCKRVDTEALIVVKSHIQSRMISTTGETEISSIDFAFISLDRKGILQKYDEI